jgi:iron complex outermembrane receptor protein
MKRNWFSIVFFGLMPGFISLAQEKAFDLPSVSISAPSKKVYQEYSEANLLDSSHFADGQNSLTALLSNRSSVYIKNYGPGNIASIALRGTAAAHTAIVWKGIPINNSMLGMSDLSQINGPVLSNAKLQEGGKSQMAVTENFGGILILGEELNEKSRSQKANLGFSVGSFSTFQHHASIQTNIQKANLKLSFWNISAANNFKYELEGIEKRQTNAFRLNRGLETSLVLPIRQNVELETAVWAQENESEIPASMHQSKSEAKQKDENIRISNRLNWVTENVQIQVGQGFTNDVLKYVDPVSSINSKSKVFNHLAWLETKKELRNWDFSGNVWSSVSKAETNNYKEISEANRLAFTGSASHHLDVIPLNFSGQMRAEHYNYYNSKINGLAFLPSFSVDLNLRKSGLFQIGIHRKMRLPTLNDLYWHPGGNPNLAPEIGWTSDLSWKIGKRLTGTVLLESDVQAFGSQIQNYIQWLPEGNIWKPSNIAEIHILGSGVSEKISWRKGDFQIYTCLNLQFTRSIQAKKRFEGDESKGKQLIYIPLWQSQINLGFKKRNLEGQFRYQFTDRRFVDPTNSLWLYGFGIINARLSQKLSFEKNFTFSVFAEGLNLSKTNYQMVAGFAMPFRQFSVGIQLQFF